MLKYFADKGGPQHGGALHWPGLPSGIPFRGDTVPDLKQHELEALPLALDFKSGRFRLWVEEENAAFNDIMDKIANGWFMQHKRFEHFIPEEMHYVVFLEWVQIYGELPKGKSPGSGTNAVRQAPQYQPAARPQAPVVPTSRTLYGQSKFEM